MADVSGTGIFDLLGVNIAGAAFGTGSGSEKLGTNYVYPSHAEIDYYAAKGMSVIRLSLLWERLQSQLNSPLDARQLDLIDDVVTYANAKGLKVDLDLHNYAMRAGTLIGTPACPDSAFANLWGQLAGHFKANPNVMFGLMNEPHVQSATAWLVTENAAIAAIRAAGATSQEILVSGSYWDGASTWTTSDNAAVIGRGIIDPAHNFVFEVHEYFDADASGTHSTVVSPTIGVERLTAITKWAEATHNRLFLGEFGAAPDAASLTTLANTLSYMAHHTGAWQGGTYWAGGPWWGDYPFSIEPEHGVDRPQMAILSHYLVPVHANVPSALPAILLPATLEAQAGKFTHLPGIVVSDPEPLAALTVTVTSVLGALNTRSTAGVAASGQGSHSLSLIGSATAVDQALAMLGYQAGSASATSPATDSLTIHVSDAHGHEVSGVIDLQLRPANPPASVPMVTIDLSVDGSRHSYAAGVVDTLIVTGSGGSSLRLGAGHDVVQGGSGKDLVIFGAGLGTVTGGQGGNNTYIFVKGSITDPATQHGKYNTITDFHGAGKYWSADHDFIWLQGFSAGTRITFEHDLPGNPATHLYRIDDGAYHAEIGLAYQGAGVQLKSTEWKLL